MPVHKRDRQDRQRGGQQVGLQPQRKPRNAEDDHTNLDPGVGKQVSGPGRDAVTDDC